MIFEYQFYRIVTSEFTHGNLSHIIFNASTLIIFGVEVEKVYGTFFYATLHFWLMVLSQFFDIWFQFAMVYWVPDFAGGRNLAYLSTCNVGYSNILFGVLMLFAFTGDTYTSYFGFRFRKICVPALLLVLTSVAVPDSSFTGHLFGIIAALVVKFGGFLSLRLLP